MEDEKHGEAHGMISDEIGQDVLKRIFFITERVIVFDGLDDVFEHIVKTSVMLTKAEAATIRVFDINTGKLAIVKGYGLSTGFLSQPPIKLGEGITGRVVLEGKPFSTEDVTTVPHCVHKELAKLEGIRAVMSVPLKTRENTIGCITVYRKQAEPFADHEMLLLNIFASQATEAVEKTRLLEELKKQAMFDPLTGVYNKNAILRELDAKIESARRHGYNTSIVFIDIDDFKKFNDTHGHLLGDKFLADFATLVKKCCRKGDLVGRFGGEEFLVIAPHTDKEGALKLAEKLRDAVSKHEFIGRDGYVHATLSAGVSSVPEDGLGMTDVLKKADDAMYQSKRSGKNCVTAAMSSNSLH
ncbi:sensor domain-containing diguanylate cyclase [Pelomicrobium methylotrophicum]|uniref:diguanylate cyclase n=1 Tax=Pelomicrobium methylotrophicum TaxID=2602750 RepID=A0A5C7ENJ3_9PROT|nr:sensor domain-containing diguanylate cyclase [Pelomicrobium methylotrophicum]TXF09894.1 GGDEF domain-containing protein [Pelomicrobium methylotrophicum]